MATITDEQLADIINMPVEDLVKMRHYQMRSVSDRIRLALTKNDEGLWEDTTAKERAEQDVEKATKKLSTLEELYTEKTRREYYMETSCKKCAILQHCKSVSECDNVCKANFDNGRICFCGQTHREDEKECPYFEEIK